MSATKNRREGAFAPRSRTVEHPREVMVAVRFSEQETTLIDRAAKKAGMSRSEFVRDAVGRAI